MLENVSAWLHQPVQMDVLELALIVVLVWSFASLGGVFVTVFMLDSERAATERARRRA
jgi:hypothetical protein